jgi:hypothetical protein
MSRTLVIVGLIIAAVGMLWPWLDRLGLGRLPGDILPRRSIVAHVRPMVA